MPTDAQLLVAYARQGDVESLATLVGRHEKWLSGLLRGLSPDDDAAADAYQETWLRVMRACGGYRGGSVKGYLARAARTVVIDRFRRVRPMVSLDAAIDSGEDGVAQLCDSAPSPDEVFELRATYAELREAVRNLPEGPREVFLLRVEGELAFREIAETMGIPLGTALTWMRVATMSLRKSMGRQHG